MKNRIVTQIEKAEPQVDAAAIAAALGANGGQVHLQGAEPAKRSKKASASPKSPDSEPDLMAEILGALDGTAVSKAIDTAKQILTNTGSVDVFVKAINAADELAESKFDFSKNVNADKGRWYAQDLNALKTQLQRWAEGGDQVAAALLKPLAAFGKSKADVTGQLWRLMVEIVRPARGVDSFPAFRSFMNSLHKSKMVVMEVNQRAQPEDVVLRDPKTREMLNFFPPKGDNLSRIGWRYIKDAEARARTSAVEFGAQKHDQFLELKSEDTGLTFEQAKAGQEGSVFLTIKETRNQGALVRVRMGQRTVIAKIIETIGLGRQIENARWIDWDANEMAWPDEKMFRAFRTWVNNTRSETSAQPAE